MQIGALDLVERDGRQGAVNARLDQRSGLPRDVCLGAHPLRLQRRIRPQHDHRLGRSKPLLDNLGVGTVGGQFIVAPDIEALRRQCRSDLFCLRLGRAGIGDKDVRYVRLSLRSARSLGEAIDKE